METGFFKYVNKSTGHQPTTGGSNGSPLPGAYAHLGSGAGDLVVHGQLSTEPTLPQINIVETYDHKAKNASFLILGCSVDFAKRVAQFIPEGLGKQKIVVRKDGTPELRISMERNDVYIESVRKRTEAMVASCHAIGMTRTDFEDASADELIKELWTEKIKFSGAGGITVELGESFDWPKGARCFLALVQNDKLLPAYILAETALGSRRFEAYGQMNETLEMEMPSEDLKKIGRNVSDRLIYLSVTQKHYDPICAADLLLRELARGKVQPTQYLKDLVAAHLLKHLASHPELSLDQLCQKYAQSGPAQEWIASVKSHL
jgi:hypothetical protein